MFNFIILGLTCLQILGVLSGDIDEPCRVDQNDYNDTGVYCYYLKLDEKPLPLSAEISPSERISLHLIECTGRIDESSFSNLRDIDSLDIVRSDFDKFILPALPKLTYVRIGETKLPTLSGAWKNTKNVNGISFSQNEFPIEDDAFENLDELESIDIHKQAADLGGQLLKHATKLKKLIMNEAEIEYIPKEAFQNNPDLVDITLNFNKVSNIENGAFDSLTKLEWLSLLHSELKTFDLELTKNLKNLNHLGVPVRAIRNLNLQQFLKNCPNFSAFEFLPQDTECPEIDVLLEEIRKSKKFIGLMYVGEAGEKKSC